MKISNALAPTKTLAKLANHCAKKLQPWQPIWGMLSLDCQAGRLGYPDSRRVENGSPRRLREQFGVVVERTQAELNGEPCIEIETAAANKQQIVSSRSFAGLVTELADLEASITTHVSRAAEKLRA